jgi:hypothetical protein
MPHSDEKNLVLSNFDVNGINLQPTDGEKIKQIITYLEDVHTLLRKQDENIKTLLDINDSLILRLDSHGGHLKAHDQHLASHDGQLDILYKK